jgi:hypothetical protein
MYVYVCVCVCVCVCVYVYEGDKNLCVSSSLHHISNPKKF